jgi:site-specific recombinase XerC
MTTYVDSVSRPARTLTDNEQRLLLKVTGQRRDGFRDHVIYSVALGSGLREHEILALNVGDVFDDAGHAKRRVRLRVFKRASDDPAPQEVMLPDVVRAKLEKLMAGRRRDGEVTGPDTPIFVSRLGTRLSARQLRHAFGVWQKRCGFDRHFSFHCLRHSSCSGIYRASRDIRLTQRFARHKSILSTAIYTHPSDEELLRSVQPLIC